MTNNSTIENCRFYNNMYSILLWSFDNGIVTNCEFYDNVVSIAVHGNNTTIKDNLIVNSSWWGIGFFKGGKNIAVINNTVRDCHTNENSIGIILFVGYRYEFYDNCTIAYNIVYNNDIGLGLVNVFNSIIANNIIYNNSYCGLYIYNSSNNLIYNNILNNTNNTMIEQYSINNRWNVTKRPSKNIVGGNYLGGNAWLKPDGTGFSQTCNDIDGDGICDEPFKIDDNNIDYLPLAVKITQQPQGRVKLYDENMNLVGTYNNIQDAVNNASYGYTIVVGDGIYEENVIVKTNGITIKSENGSSNCIVRAKNESQHVFFIEANNITIEGLTIENALGTWKDAVIFYNAADCTIKDCIIRNSFGGVNVFWNSENCSVINNTIINCTFAGIRTDGARYVVITNNIVDNIHGRVTTGISWYGDGIKVYNSSYVKVTDNLVTNATDEGIDSEKSDHVIVAHNDVINVGHDAIDFDCCVHFECSNNFVTNATDDGIDAENSKDFTVDFNVIVNSTDHGIDIDNSNDFELYANLIEKSKDDGISIGSSSFFEIVGNVIKHGLKSLETGSVSWGIIVGDVQYCNIENNTLEDNYGGIDVYKNCSDVELTKNTITNDTYGIYIGENCSSIVAHMNTIANCEKSSLKVYKAKHVRIFLNDFINPTGWMPIYNSTDVHLNSTEPIKYQYNGQTFTSYLGNYWSDYNGSDINGDGIGDTPYIIDDQNKDYYPLIKPADNYMIVHVKGDFNGNGYVDIGDIVYVASMVVGKKPQDINADFNSNGRVDIGDLAKIAYYFLKKIDTL
jgi:parallel beta-helix repeat protein